MDVTHNTPCLGGRVYSAHSPSGTPHKWWTIFQCGDDDVVAKIPEVFYAYIFLNDSDFSLCERDRDVVFFLVVSR